MKVGVAVIITDVNRLRAHLKLKPTAVFDLKDDKLQKDAKKVAKKEAKKAVDGSAWASADASCRSLYDRLASHRNTLAASKGVSSFTITRNATLQAMALHRPSNEQELLLISGIGKYKAAQYGPAWLEIIREFGKKQEQGDPDKQQVSDRKEDGGPQLESEDRDPNHG
ncbi:HRDC domain-containing protein [Xylaria cf. heliscus]|nr:HRDC domain-containing protein [Xylaria cf. heliscus]